MSNSTTPYELTTGYYQNISLRNHINFAINTFTTAIASAVIIWKSPKAMKTYKWFLLNIAIWSYLMDFNMTLFFVPVFMFPAPALCSLGFVNTILGVTVFSTGVPFAFLIITLGACGAALACALYYRYRLLNNKSVHMFNKKQFILAMLGFHFISGTPVLIAAGISIFCSKALDGSYWWPYMYEKYNFTWRMMTYCLNEKLCVCGGIVMDTNGTWVLLFAILTEIVVYTLLVILGPWYIYYCLKKRSKMITQKKYDHEKKIILSLFTQSIIPLACLMLPYIFSVVEVIFQFEISFLLTILIQISTLHSFFNALAMIMLLKPYREAIKDVIGLKYVRERISGLNSNNPHDNRSSFALVAPKTQVQMVKPMSGNHQLDQWATRRKSVFVMTQL